MPIRHLRPRHRSYGSYIPSPNPRRPDKPRSFWRPWMLKVGVAVVVGASLIGIGTFAWISKNLPDPNRLSDRQVAESTKIYDRTGTHLLYEIYQNEKRTIVPLSDINPLAIKATIAVEDKYFYQHKGVRLISIFRAGVSNLLGLKSGSGGASTITQQLIKKTIVGDERRGFAGLFRKIKEALLARQIEKKYSKDDILKLYFNEIGYGSTNYGIESAAQSYFHKSAKDISLPEAATLAALPQRPGAFLNNLPALRQRRDLVLALMADQGYITQEEKTAAQKTELTLFRNAGIKTAPHFVLYVKQLLADQFGEQTVDTSGLKVITTLDYDKQMAAQEIVKKYGDQFAKEANANNASLVAIDPKTGQILALVGSRDFFDETIDGQFNIAVQSNILQPGSSFKPFVYAAAFEKGYTPETVLYDVVTDFDLRDGTNKYTPKNYNGQEYGLVTMRQALQGSLNIPAVKTLYLVGYQYAIEFAKRFGYTTFTGDYGLSLVLGGGGVNLLEHTNAYATLANNGIYHTPVSLLKVTNPQGQTLIEWKETPGKAAILPDVAATITNVLADNPAREYVFGRVNNLTLPDRPVAAKTGTTNNSYDVWTMGYTPSLAAGVWVGNTPNHNTPMKGKSNQLAGGIWNEFMKTALKNTPPENFPLPPPNTSEKAVLRGAVGGIKLAVNSVTGNIASSSTPSELVVEKTFLPPHDILFYVDKDNPQGPPPAFPADDPQYQNWENALQNWAEQQSKKGKIISFSEPPSESDSAQTNNSLTPTISITSPTNNQQFDSRQLLFKVSAGAPRGIFKVSYFIDDELVGSNTGLPFELSYFAQFLPPGSHRLKVQAADDLGNTASTETSFNLTSPLENPITLWSDRSPVAVVGEDFPHTFFLTPYRWDDIKDVKIFFTAENKAKRLIYTFDHLDKLFNNKLVLTMKHNPGAGTHLLQAITSDKSGNTIERNLTFTIK